ncbi:hypothetical protein GCM10027089_28410 [Nocardia thraciensis]
MRVRFFSDTSVLLVRVRSSRARAFFSDTCVLLGHARSSRTRPFLSDTPVPLGHAQLPGAPRPAPSFPVVAAPWGRDDGISPTPGSAMGIAQLVAPVSLS